MKKKGRLSTEKKNISKNFFANKDWLMFHNTQNIFKIKSFNFLPNCKNLPEISFSGNYKKFWVG